jgi:hypothetical protein
MNSSSNHPETEMTPAIRSTLGLLAGLAVGGTYAYYAKCTGTTCNANDTPAIPIIVGGLLGLFVTSGGKA